VRQSGAGIVVEPANAAALSEALESLLIDFEKRRLMGERAARLVANNYSWDNHARIVEKEYLRLAG
jgi:glycosyltransferase involved in cell wall biosynthesis